MIALGFVLALWVQPKLPLRVAPLINEARALARTQGDAIWPGFGKTPFPILYVDKANSFLFCPAGAAKGFTALGRDPFTKCMIKTRTRVFAPALKATFPAVDNIATVVIGAPTQAQGNATTWIATLLHEHFHQMQMGWPGYYEAVKALDLSDGQNGGGWMLNFPFPYSDDEVAGGFALMAENLATVLRSDDADLAATLSAYRKARRRAFARLNAREVRYGEFQLWQEGIARYSEIALAEAAIERARRDTRPYDYSALAVNLRNRVLENLQNFDLQKNKRVSFYALGAGEGLLLDRIRPNWRTQYFRSGMAMGPLLEKAE
jgi:ketosteroid isomerase-like protein